MYSSGGDTDTVGNIYTADTGNGQVEAFDPNGNLLWRAGQEVANKKSLGQFLNPRDLAYLNAPGFGGLNGAGLLFVADLGNNRVQVLNAYDGSTNSLTSSWNTRFNSIIGISAGVNGAGNPVVIATDSVSSTPVREFTPGGALVASVGGKCTTTANTCGPNVLLAPRDAATDAQGNVYVADYSNNRIVEFGAGNLSAGLRTWGSRGTGNLQFNHPYGVTFDDQGHLYVADSDNGRIQEFDVSGATPSYIGTYGGGGKTPGNGGFFTLRRVAVAHGPAPHVIGFDLWGNALSIFQNVSVSPFDGGLVNYVGGQPAGSGAFNSPYGLTLANGSLLVADTNNQRVQAFDAGTGSFQFLFGQRGFGETNLGFNWPRSVTYAPATNTVWIADTKNFRVSEYSMDGVATGRTFGTAKLLNWPYDVEAYGTRVAVADTVNNRVQMWDPSTNTVLWSTDQLGISMKQPRALTLAADPNNAANKVLYVADSLNHRVLVLDADTGRLLQSIDPRTTTGAPL
ncbi:MAG: tripartite motif-containing protein 71, partial [Nocardioidaceae bacterium]|nr:tripartite motif-containing protein 71 [Nocardioidaceae bacterium]